MVTSNSALNHSLNRICKTFDVTDDKAAQRLDWSQHRNTQTSLGRQQFLCQKCSAEPSKSLIIIRVPIRKWYKSNQTILCVWMATYFLIVIVVSTFTLAEQKHAAIPIRSPCRHAAHSWKKAHACSFLSCRNKHKEIAAPFKPTQVVLSATTHPSRILSLHGFTHISVATPTAHHTIFFAQHPN